MQTGEIIWRVYLKKTHDISNYNACKKTICMHCQNYYFAYVMRFIAAFRGRVMLSCDSKKIVHVQSCSYKVIKMKNRCHMCRIVLLEYSDFVPANERQVVVDSVDEGEGQEDGHGAEEVPHVVVVVERQQNARSIQFATARRRFLQITNFEGEIKNNFKNGMKFSPLSRSFVFLNMDRN